jgi:hypothetical protein
VITPPVKRIEVSDLATPDAPRESIRADAQSPANPYVTGCGCKVPTSVRLRLSSEQGPRWHRVYSMVYGNAGSAYVRRGGKEVFLSIDVEYLLRDS